MEDMEAMGGTMDIHTAIIGNETELAAEGTREERQA